MALETTEQISALPSKNKQSRLTVEIIVKPLQLFFTFQIKSSCSNRRNKSPDIDAIYEHVMKSEASNADKNLIETIVAEQNVIIKEDIPWTRLFL